MVTNCTQRILMVMGATLALAGCATSQPGIRVERVEVPTPIACPDAQTAADLAAAEPEKVGSQLTGNAATDLPIVAASALELRAWGQEVLAVVRGCAG